MGVVVVEGAACAHVASSLARRGGLLLPGLKRVQCRRALFGERGTRLHMPFELPARIWDTPQADPSATRTDCTTPPRPHP